jgi:hypothetical protein
MKDALYSYFVSLPAYLVYLFFSKTLFFYSSHLGELDGTLSNHIDIFFYEIGTSCLREISNLNGVFIASLLMFLVFYPIVKFF